MHFEDLCKKCKEISGGTVPGNEELQEVTSEIWAQATKLSKSLGIIQLHESERGGKRILMNCAENIETS